MDSTFDGLLAPRLIFTVVAILIAVGPIMADFNRTHATNPLWTPHARFHVVWQVLGQTGVSLVILWLIWMPAPDHTVHLGVAATLIYVWIASFFATLAAMPLYGGALKDTNGIKPFRFNIFGRVYLVDTNLFGACVLLVVNSIGVALLVT